MADMPVFQFAPQVVQGRVGATGAAPTLGVSGGTPLAAGMVRHNEQVIDPNIGADVPDFIAEAFAPRLQEAKRERMWQGFVAARNGMSAKEIADQQPWYTQVFGPTDFEMGAQTFAVQKAGADMVADFNANLPELRKLPPEQLAARLNEMHGKLLTGDGFTDALVTKTIMDQSGQLLDLHHKARYAWQQDELVTGKLDAARSAAKAAQGMMSAYAMLGKDAPDQEAAGRSRDEAKLSYLSVLQTDEFQDPASVQRFMENHVKQLAEDGNWYALGALRETGLEHALPPETALQLGNYIDAQWQQFKNKAVLDGGMLKELAYLKYKAAQGIGGEETAAEMTAFNDKFKARYGGNAYFEDDEIAATATGSMNAWAANYESAQRAQAAAAKAAGDEQAKADAEARNLAQITQAVLTGTAGAYERLADVKREDMDRVVSQVYNDVSSSHPAEAGQLLVWNYANGQEPSTFVKRDIQRNLEGAATEQYNDAFMKSFQTWRNIRDGKGWTVDPVTGKPKLTQTTFGAATAIAYFGPEMHKRMERFNRQLNAGMPAPVAYASTFGEDLRETDVRGLSSEETKVNQKEIESALDGIEPGMWSRLFGGENKLTANNRLQLSRMIYREWGDLDQMGNPVERAQAAIRMARSNGVEIHGHYLWNNAQGQDSVAKYLGHNEASAATLVDRSISSALRRAGVKVSNDTTVQVVRLPDTDDGIPVLYATAYTDDGWVYARVTGKEMKQREKDEITTRVTAEKNAPPMGYFRDPAGGLVPKR